MGTINQPHVTNPSCLPTDIEQLYVAINAGHCVISSANPNRNPEQWERFQHLVDQASTRGFVKAAVGSSR